jgi:hypothetical protein
MSDDPHGGQMPHIDPATRWKDRDAGIDGDDMRCICGARWPCLTFLGVLGHAMSDDH